MIGRTIKLFLLNLYVPKSKRVKHVNKLEMKKPNVKAESRLTVIGFPQADIC